MKQKKLPITFYLQGSTSVRIFHFIIFSVHFCELRSKIIFYVMKITTFLYRNDTKRMSVYLASLCYAEI